MPMVQIDQDGNVTKPGKSHSWHRGYLTYAIAAVAVAGVTIVAGAKGFDKQDAIDVENQEGFRHEVMPTEFRGRIIHDTDCGKNEDGTFSVFSGGKEVPNTTAVFNERRLADAVPDALGSCSVTVTNETGKEIDSYVVNAYPKHLVQYGPVPKN